MQGVTPCSLQCRCRLQSQDCQLVGDHTLVVFVSNPYVLHTYAATFFASCVGVHSLYERERRVSHDGRKFGAIKSTCCPRARSHMTSRERTRAIRSIGWEVVIAARVYE